MLRTTTGRVFLLGVLSLCSLLSSAADGPVKVSGTTGLPLEFNVGLASGEGQSLKAFQFPSGLRITEGGVIVGTPLIVGETLSQVRLVDSNHQILAQKELLFVITSEANVALGSRSCCGGIVVSSHLYASSNPAEVNQSMTLAVAATETAHCALVYSWNFGDGNTLVGSSGSVNHSFSVSGSYNVSVKISNGNSEVVEATTVVVESKKGTSSSATTTKPTTSTASPFSTLQITGTFNLTTHKYAIGFVFVEGKKGAEDLIAKVPVMQSESSSTTLVVMVPPFLKKNKYGAGKTHLFLYIDDVATDLNHVLSIIDLPKVKTKLGLPTISYLRMNRILFEAVKPTLAASEFISAQLITECNTSISSLNTMITNFENTSLGRTATGEKAAKDKVGVNTLIQFDRFTIGMLVGGSKVEDASYAAACTTWLSALTAAKDGNDAALLAAEKTYMNAFLTAMGASSIAKSTSSSTSPASRGVFSKAFGYTVGILTVTAVGVVTTVAVVGGTTLTAAATAVLAPVAVAATVIGVTATATVAVTAATVGVLGIASGSQTAKDTSKELIKESSQILIDTGVNTLGLVPKTIIKLTGSGSVVDTIVEHSNTVSTSTTKIKNGTPQSSGTFSAGIIPSGSSYYIVVKGTAGHALTATVSGSDGYSASFSGTGSITSSTIPAGASGVSDTITCKDSVTSESQTFSFTF